MESSCSSDTLTETLRGARVLVVEDDPLITFAIEDMIDDLGCVLAGSAASVAEALPLVAAASFDVALIDLHLGDELALPVAEAVRSLGKPFLFASGLDEAPEGFADAPRLPKPYRIERLAQGLCEALLRPS